MALVEVSPVIKRKGGGGLFGKILGGLVGTVAGALTGGTGAAAGGAIGSKLGGAVAKGAFRGLSTGAGIGEFAGSAISQPKEGQSSALPIKDPGAQIGIIQSAMNSIPRSGLDLSSQELTKNRLIDTLNRIRGVAS